MARNPYWHYTIAEAHRHYGRKYAPWIFWGRLLWHGGPWIGLAGLFVALVVGAHWLFERVGATVVSGLSFGLALLFGGALLFSKATSSAVAARAQGQPLLGRAGLAVLATVVVLLILSYVTWP